MRIQVCMASAANNTEREVLRNFFDGMEKYFCTKHGVSNLGTLRKIANIQLYLNYDPAVIATDVAVQFGGVKERGAEHHVVKQAIKEKINTVIFIETPILGRVINERHDYQYYRVGVNGFLNDAAIFFQEDHLDSARLTKVTYDLNLPKFPGWQNNPDGPIVVLVQLPGDSSLRGQRMSEWLLDTLEALTKQFDNQIVVRLHPAMSAKGVGEFLAEVSPVLLRNYDRVHWRDGKTKTLADDLNGARFCINYSSGAAVDAVLMGVPTVTADRGGMAYPVSMHSLGDVEKWNLANDTDIKSWLIHLAHSQWSVPEIRSGKIWKHLDPILAALNQ